ncbi:type IV pilin [Natrarchaeobius halalkaliphilus]|uniref:Type IV pilin n=1 Tax=Natrarchaeobius halalkaliphilus TaxID=1679091 RepID=A0A3N6LY61_9EURY|nr:type IV pilin N-terminal domain-containing protein [Natrarchaeobius halalkaliphilus]RQG87041.1 type IV pilin [Natrarchaeobius halalkaliphilus]
MDAKLIQRKLVGEEQERAVSPVIGVILMVAITVILAAVIAAFVLDLGGSVGQEAQAGVSIDVDESAEEVSVEITSLGNSNYVDLSSSEWGDGMDGTEDNVTNMDVGDTVTLEHDKAPQDINESGTVSAVAVIEESETRTSVASEDWDF